MWSGIQRKKTASVAEINPRYVPLKSWRLLYSITEIIIKIQLQNEQRYRVQQGARKHVIKRQMRSFLGPPGSPKCLVERKKKKPQQFQFSTL